MKHSPSLPLQSRHPGMVALLLSLALASSAWSQTVAPFYTDSYGIRDLGGVPGLSESVSSLVFTKEDPNKLLVRVDQDFVVVNVRRNADQRITGFAGPLTVRHTAPAGFQGSLVYGPDGVLFFNNSSSDAIGQIKPDEKEAAKHTFMGDLRYRDDSLGNVAAVAFVPGGLPGAGRFKFAAGGLDAPGGWYDTTVSADGDGTFDIANPGRGLPLPFPPEAAVFIPAGAPKFRAHSVLMSDYNGGRIVSYEIDAQGDPILTTARNVVTGLVQALGIARDPITGDFLLTPYNGSTIYLLGQVPAAPPAVTLVAPANNSSFGTKEPINLKADASLPAGSNAQIVVEFFDGATSIGFDGDTPFEAGLPVLSPGVHVLKAVATANGLSTTSSVVTITITNTPNVLPIVRLTSPLNSPSFTECSAVTLAAEASDTDGFVKSVSFYVNDVLLLGTVAQPPYVLVVEGLPFATNSITAVATDDAGGRGTSAAGVAFTQVLPLHTLKGALVSGARLQLCFRGAPGSNYVFEASGDVGLAAVWQPFTTNTAPLATDGLIQWVESVSSTTARKFYRARRQ